MARKQRHRKTNPIYYVFCEGKSEESYIKYLKRMYKKPITFKICAKNAISLNKIDYYFKKDKNFDKTKDKIFLMYDLDVEVTLKELQAIKQNYKKDIVQLLVSNPCFELWYLLHYQQQTAKIKSKECESILQKKYLSNYKKGTVPSGLQDKQSIDMKNAEKLNLYQNPSTTIIKLIKALEKYTRP